MIITWYFSLHTIQFIKLNIHTTMNTKGYNMHNELVLLGKRIAQIRIKRGLTQEKLAEMAGYSTNHIAKLEIAGTNPSFELLIKLANALSIELSDLFTFDKPKPPKYIKNKFQKIIDKSDDKKIQLLYKIFRAIDN